MRKVCRTQQLLSLENFGYGCRVKAVVVITWPVNFTGPADLPTQGFHNIQQYLVKGRIGFSYIYLTISTFLTMPFLIMFTLVCLLLMFSCSYSSPLAFLLGLMLIMLRYQTLQMLQTTLTIPRYIPPLYRLMCGARAGSILNWSGIQSVIFLELVYSWSVLLMVRSTQRTIRELVVRTHAFVVLAVVFHVELVLLLESQCREMGL